MGEELSRGRFKELLLEYENLAFHHADFGEVSGIRYLLDTHDDALREQLEECQDSRDDWLGELEAAQARVKEMEEALVADAADLWTITNAIKQAIEARDWIVQGRGPYEWDDDRYKEEAGLAFEEVLLLIKGVQIPASNRFHQALAAKQGEAT